MSETSLLHEDVTLLHRIAAGDEQAFRIIFNRYHNRLGAYIFKITQSRELAQEITQDVFLKIWTNRETLTDIANFKAYLFTASKNYALTHLKKMALEKNRVITFESAMDVQHNEDAEENERSLLIDEAIDNLPPQQRQVYLLSRHERLKYTEVATRLNLSRETVKKYLQLSSESISNYIRKRLIINTLVMILYLI